MTYHNSQSQINRQYDKYKGMTVQDLKVIAGFNKIVMNYLRMQKEITKAMKEEEILRKLKSRQLNSEQALEYLAETGSCPNILNDDNGHWAISFVGMQNVPMTDEPEDITTTMFVEAKYWKDSIREALIYALEND